MTYGQCVGALAKRAFYLVRTFRTETQVGKEGRQDHERIEVWDDSEQTVLVHVWQDDTVDVYEMADPVQSDN